MIAIIGGGISGLALAHQLAERGAEFTLFESELRPGGVIRSDRVEGQVLERGPQRARLTRSFAALAAGLGIADDIITSPPDLPLYVYHHGRLRVVPFSARAFLTSDLLSPAARARVLLEPLTAAAQDDETVAGFLTRKLGREAYQHLAGPLYGGLYASDPADMTVGLSLSHVLREFGIRRSLLAPLLRRGGRIVPPPACSFVDGLETLPRALAARHRDHVRLGTAVRAMERTQAGCRVLTDTGSLDCEHVVIATSAPAAAEVLRQAASAAADRIAQLRYNPLAVVHLHADTNLRGLGYQVSLAEQLITRGVTWNDALFERTGVYTAYLGGAQNAWVAAAPEQDLARIAVQEFRTVTGFDARVLGVARGWMPAWDRSWSAIQGLELPPGIHIHANWHARPGIPGRLEQARRLADALTVSR